MSLLSPPLEAFFQVAQRGTVIDAARAIGITQTAVTQRVRSLERQLRTTLFTRSRKGMRPTDDGLALIRYCQGALELEGMVVSRLNPSDQPFNQRLILCGPSSALRSRAILPACAVRKQFPQLFLTIRFSDKAKEPMQELKEGRCHLAIVDPDEVGAELDSKLLKPQRYVLVGPSRWKRRSVRNIIQTESIVDFDESDRQTEMYLKENDLPFEKSGERLLCNNTDGLLSILANGHGFSVLPFDFVETYLNDGIISNLHPSGRLDVKLALAWYPRPEMPDWFRAILDSIR